MFCCSGTSCNTLNIISAVTEDIIKLSKNSLEKQASTSALQSEMLAKHTIKRRRGKWPNCVHINGLTTSYDVESIHPSYTGLCDLPRPIKAGVNSPGL